MGAVRHGAVAIRRARAQAEILAAAWTLGRERGLASISLRDLADRVGMQAPSLYSYFASKDEIYDAMFAEGQRALAEAAAGVPRGPLTRQALLAGARVFFAFCLANPVRYQLMFQRVVPGFVPTPAAYALAEASLADVRDRFSAAGLESRHVDLWTALLTGLADQQIANDPGGDRWERLVADAVAMFCDFAGLRAEEE